MKSPAQVRLLAAVLLGCCFMSWSYEQQTEQELLTPLSEKPIALKGNEIGDLLRKWHANGSVAGNGGDYYDNRDGGHSLLNTARYPQLQKIEYSQEQIKARLNWGVQRKLLPYVVFGNSSTAASPEQGGSNVRSYYTDRAGLSFLFLQYAGNNLYIYPEHLDHDPGHNGVGGYGDLFPTNTPYLIASQGSSGTDQPFMQALPYVLAAFRPEVKKKLAESGFLMPVIQMILRITGKNLEGVEEYLTGKAHPTVFEGKSLDARAMVEMAHGIAAANTPPVALIKVVQEDTPTPGVDYFDPGLTEKLADTPMTIARIFRGSNYLRKIIVSAEESKDLNDRPLKYYWTILRGDSNRIKIEYRNPAHSVAEITVPYQDRRPIAEHSKLESNRIDIGVFVHNGVYFSPPSFLTFYTLDNESRTYKADGRPLEIAYGAGTSTISMDSWKAFFDALDPGSKSWSGQFLRRQFKSEEITALIKVSEEFGKAHAALISAQALKAKAGAIQKAASDEIKAIQMKESKSGEAETSEELKAFLRKREQSAADITAAERGIVTARESEKKALEQKVQNLSVVDFVQKKLNLLLQDPDLGHENESNWKLAYESAKEESRKALNQIREMLIVFGLAENLDGLSFRLKPLNEGEASITNRFTRFEQGMIERFNSVLLSRFLLPDIVKSGWRLNYVDPRITSAKEWRDVYLYSPEGNFIGWRRYQVGGVSEFNAEGLLVVNKDPQGRCVRARIVQYGLKPQKSNSMGRQVNLVQTDRIREYSYDGADDWKGRIRQGIADKK